MRRYILSKRAEQELLEIFIFGHERFGERQADIYAAGLDHAFQLLGENPRMGRAADTISAGVRRHGHGAHVILYELTRNGIRVLAVVHGRSVQRLKL
jgi:toxin ParE1/3/4